MRKKQGNTCDISVICSCVHVINAKRVNDVLAYGIVVEQNSSKR